MLKNIVFLYLVFFYTLNLFALELWCDNQLYAVEKNTYLLYVSIDCAPCTDFVHKKNKEILEMPTKNKQVLPWLVFKENKPQDIHRYLIKHQLKNRACIFNKNFRKCLQDDHTPQIMQCFL